MPKPCAWNIVISRRSDIRDEPAVMGEADGIAEQFEGEGLFAGDVTLQYQLAPDTQTSGQQHVLIDDPACPCGEHVGNDKVGVEEWAEDEMGHVGAGLGEPCDQLVGELVGGVG